MGSPLRKNLRKISAEKNFAGKWDLKVADRSATTRVRFEP